MYQIQSEIATYLIVTLAVAGLWLIFRTFQKKRVDSRFGIKLIGGRGGEILVRKGSEFWHAEYEVGAKVNLIIYGSSLTNGGKRPLSTANKAEMVETLKAWAKSMRFKNQNCRRRLNLLLQVTAKKRAAPEQPVGNTKLN